MLALMNRYKNITEKNEINQECLVLKNRKIYLVDNEYLFKLVTFVYIFSLPKHYNFYISTDDKFLYFFLKLKNCFLYKYISEISIDENTVIIDFNMSADDFIEINKKKFALMIYYNPDVGEGETVTLIPEKNHFLISYNELTKVHEPVNNSGFNFFTRKILEEYNKSYVKEFGTAREKLILFYHDFIENGKIKRGELNNVIQFLYGKSKNGKSFKEINDLLVEINPMYENGE